MRKVPRESKKLNLFGPMIVCFVLILASIIFGIFKLGVFNIKTIEVNVINDLGCASKNQLKDASQLLSQNLLLINSANTLSNIKERYICVKDVNLSKQFPDIVRLDVLGREPKAKLLNFTSEATTSANLENIATPSTAQSLDTFLVDERVIFAKDANRFLVPTIFLDDPNLSMGRKVDQLIGKALDILEKLKNSGLNIQTTEIVEHFFIIFPEDFQPKIIFHLEKDINAQIASLQLILKIARINGRTVPTEVGIDSSQVEFIDLRFDKPIVRFAPKKN